MIFKCQEFSKKLKLHIFSASICSSSTYKKSDKKTACLININAILNYPDGVTACNNIAARLPEIKNAAEQIDVASRMVLKQNRLVYEFNKIIDLFKNNEILFTNLLL